MEAVKRPLPRTQRLGVSALNVDRVFEELRLGTGSPTGAIADILADYLATATSLVDAYKGDDTPDSIRSEAIVRCVGWLYDTPTTSRSTGRHTILIASGAADLLAPWRPVRALPIDPDAADDD